MFEDSNFDDGKKKGRTLRVSLVVSVGLFAVLILIPLIYTEALSAEQLRVILVTPQPPPPPPPPCLRPQGPRPPAERIRVSSGVTARNIISQVEVPYPAMARQARISGIVLLEAIIGPNGTIQHLCVIVGHPLLAPAALEAVGQWKYRPTMIDGEPVEVITTISVPFSFSSD